MMHMASGMVARVDGGEVDRAEWYKRIWEAKCRSDVIIIGSDVQLSKWVVGTMTCAKGGWDVWLGMFPRFFQLGLGGKLVGVVVSPCGHGQRFLNCKECREERRQGEYDTLHISGACMHATKGIFGLHSVQYRSKQWAWPQTLPCHAVRSRA
jgi:hypothetical protein